VLGVFGFCFINISAHNLKQYENKQVARDAHNTSFKL
jgi:hypothetical protein